MTIEELVTKASENDKAALELLEKEIDSFINGSLFDIPPQHASKGFPRAFLYPDPDFNLFTTAIIAIWDALARAGSDPSAEIWCLRDRYRQFLHALVAIKWAELTGWKPIEFPYTLDIVARAWMSFRKADYGQKNKLIDRVEPQLPYILLRHEK